MTEQLVEGAPPNERQKLRATDTQTDNAGNETCLISFYFDMLNRVLRSLDMPHC